MEMAPSGHFSFYENLDRSKNMYYQSSSFLLSPFLSNCMKSSIFSDHDYIIKNIDTVIESPSKMTADDEIDCLEKDNISNSEVTTPNEDRMSPAPISGGESKVSPIVIDDVALVSEQETPLSNEGDFLQGLDELDFDFDYFDPSQDVSVENNFQNFIDATLDDTINDGFSCSNGEEGEGEDVYKKEFFMKHISLQRTSPQPTVPKNRKRKHEEDSELASSHSSSFHNISTTTTTTSSFKKSLIVTTQDNKNNTLPSPAHTLPPVHSVPSKLNSWATSDWQRTILYSTAKSSSTASVQTSPSTASAGHLSHVRCSSSSSVSNISNARLSTTSTGVSSLFLEDEDNLSPSMVLSERGRNSFEFDLLDKCEMDEDTKDLLQWLDDQDIHTTISGSTSLPNGFNPSAVSPGTTSGRSTTRPSKCRITSYADDNLDSVFSPQSDVSCGALWQMESSIDLESYVTEEEPFPTKIKSEGYSTTHNGFTVTDCFPKSQLRLSILADISRDFINSEYNEKKDAIKRDILKSCRSNRVTNQTLESQSFVSECWNDSPFSSPSSYLSSPRLSDFSPSSSPASSPSSSSPTSPDFERQSDPKNLHLLDLFSDENAAWCF